MSVFNVWLMVFIEIEIFVYKFCIKGEVMDFFNFEMKVCKELIVVIKMF